MLKIRYRWLILDIFIVVVIGGILLQIFSPPTTKITIDNARYLLSAISQSLAALFALIFTISLIVLQVSFKFKGVLREFLQDRFNIIYPILSGVGIILPLVILRIGCFNILTDIAITIAGLCVLMVVPFFLRLKDFLKYNVGIREDVKYAKELINQEDVRLYESFLWEIIELSRQAINQKNYIVVRIALRELLNLSQYTYGKYKEKALAIVDETLKQFCLLLKLASREGILKDIIYFIIEVSDNINYIPFLRKYTYSSIGETLVDLAENTMDDEMKRILCCSIWVFSAKWLAQNSRERNTVKNLITRFVAKVGRQIVLECNDPSGPDDVYENAAWKLNEENNNQQMLEVIRSWVKTP